MHARISRCALVAFLASIVGCASFFGAASSDETDRPSAEDAAARDAAPANVATSDAGDAADAADSFTCPAGLLTDPFEAGWTAEPLWSPKTTGSGGYALSTVKKHAGSSSLRFSATSRDVARLDRALAGSCTFAFSAVVYVPSTSSGGGTGLFALELGGTRPIVVSLFGADLRLSTAGADSTFVGLVRDEWVKVSLTYAPATGAITLAIGMVAQTVTLAPAVPTLLRFGIMPAADGGLDGEEIFFDDVTVSR